MRLLYVSNIPSPYQLELFEHMARKGIAEVRALFCMWTYPGRGWKRPRLSAGFEVLPHWSFQWLYPDLVLSFGIKRRIREFKPDVAIVGSYMVPGLHRAMSVLSRLEIPWLYWEEFHHISSRHLLKRVVRKRLLTGALNRAAAVLAIGGRAQKWFEELTQGTKHVYNFPYASNLSRFMRAKTTHGVPKGVRFLYSGQLIPRKGVDVLIKAFTEVASAHGDCTLTIVGDGPLRRELEASIPADIVSRVEFTGQVGWEKLPELYAGADVFVFPSRHDGWGMVVPEAMAAGLPVISTREVGAAIDLVKDGETGFLFEKDDVTALTKHMTYFCEHPETVRSMGATTRDRIGYLDVSEAGRRLSDILQKYHK